MAKNKPARHRIVTTDADFDRAIERAKRLRTQPLVAEVEYRPGPGLDLLILKLTDGRRHIIPREELQGMQSATKEQIEQVEIVGVEPASTGRRSTWTSTFPACFGASMATRNGWRRSDAPEDL